jgi:hypothetical protein
MLASKFFSLVSMRSGVNRRPHLRHQGVQPCRLRDLRSRRSRIRISFRISFHCRLAHSAIPANNASSNLPQRRSWSPHSIDHIFWPLQQGFHFGDHGHNARLAIFCSSPTVSPHLDHAASKVTVAPENVCRLGLPESPKNKKAIQISAMYGEAASGSFRALATALANALASNLKTCLESPMVGGASEMGGFGPFPKALSWGATIRFGSCSWHHEPGIRSRPLRTRPVQAIDYPVRS